MAEAGGTGGKGGGVMQLIIALVIVSVIAGAGGGVAGLKLAPKPPQSASPTSGSDQSQQSFDAQPKEQAAGGMAVVDIPAVITNLKSPADVWVRLEASMVVERRPDQNPEVISGQLASDFLAYIRTLSLADIQNPDGLQLLRSDLDDRAISRSKGLVKEVLIRTLVVQ